VTTPFGVEVLAVAPHPDDVELFCGGTLLRMAELGHSTAVLDLSRGELASQGTVEERQGEVERASALLGLKLRENLQLPDGGLRDTDEQVLPVVEALRRIRPELVLIPWEEERHPDHVGASQLLTRAIFFAGLRKFGTGERFVPRQVLYYGMRYRMSPTFVMDTSTVRAKKRALMEVFVSQVQRRAGEGQTLISSPGALDAIEIRDRYYGTMIGTDSGEPLRTVNVPGIVDPLTHFRQNPFQEAHAYEPLR